MRKVLAEGSPKSPLIPQGARLLRNFISLSFWALRQALNNASLHFITQQAHLSLNLICIEQLEAGYKAAKPRMKMQRIFWLQESLIQSLETGSKNRHRFCLYTPSPTSYFGARSGDPWARW